MELVDVLDLESGAARCVGSSPTLSTEGINPETLKDKVDDNLERQVYSFIAQW